MKSENSLRSTINKGMIIVSILSVSLIGAFWTFQEYTKANNGIYQLKEEYIEERKHELKIEVDRVISYIDYNRTSTEQQLKDSIKTRVYEAYEIARGIYNYYQGKKSDEEIKVLIREALRQLIFNEGRGYFFIYDMQGNNVLLPFSPHLEGENLWDLQDSNGNYTIRDAAAMMTEQGEGFQHWHWYKPGENREMSEKIGFNKYFEPFNWWIGTGEYIEDYELDIQNKTLDWINKIRFGKDGYIFVYNFDGTVEAHFINESIGTNVLEETEDPYGIQIVSDLIQISQNDSGGFLNYVGKIRPSTGTRAEKIGYSRSVSDWHWTVGAGVYVDEINETINAEQKNLIRQLGTNITIIAIVFIISLVIIGFILRFISRKTTDHLAIFTRFFKDASLLSVKINENDVYFTEFRELAKSVNRMMIDRENAEKEVSKLRNYLANIIDSMPSTLVGVDKEHKITQWNKQAEKISGVPFAQAKGKKISEILPTFSETHKLISQAISQKKVFHESKCITDEDAATSRYEDIVIFPLVSNGTEGAVIRIDDVTDQHEIQIELSHSRRLDAIGQLAGGVAHDFNNMLAGMLGFAELLKIQVEGNTDAMEFVEMIMQSGQRAGELTNKLLAFARKGTVKSTPISIKDTLDEAVDILKHSLDKRVNISVTMLAENTTVIGDASQIQNVLINLGVNAGHAMPDGGDLSFHVKSVSLDQNLCEQSSFEIAPGDYLQIDVSDTGVGIPEKNLDKIFEPFYTTREAGEGSGLGLAAVYGTVQQHKGSISLHSEMGSGTVFKILLPLSVNQKETDVDKELHISGSGKLLLIEDEEILRKTTSSILENLGYEVNTAEDGQSGLKNFKQHHDSIDLVILDMIMPKMSGKECFYALRKVSPEIKIILISGFTQEDDLKDLKKDGLQGFLKKPFTTSKLSRVIANALK